MRRDRLASVSVPLLLALASLTMLAGCGGSDDDDTPSFSTTAIRFSAPSGSNADGNEFVPARGSASQDSTTWRVFLRDAAAQRNIEIELPTNAAGSYPVNGTTVSVVYGQDIPTTDGGNWTASSGTVIVDSLSVSQIRLRLVGVRATATVESGNAATGSFTMNGTLTYDPQPL